MVPDLIKKANNPDDEPILSSLIIDDDLGDAELIFDVERVFDIKIENSEASTMRTVGDLFDAILKRFPEFSEKQRVCLTAVMYYRLRRHLVAIQPMQHVAPDTRLEPLLASMPLRRTWQRIEDPLSLRLPELEIGWTPVGPLARLCQRTSPLLSILWGALLVPAVILAIPSFLLTAPFIQRIPRQIETVGDLAREMVSLHLGHLSREYPPYSRDDLWRRFETLLWTHAGSSPKSGRIGPQTEFF